MIESVWEFVVKEEARGQFELAYGPGGAWSTLFADCAGFRGTTLLRDAKEPRRYLAIDLWDTEAQREEALVHNQAAHADLQTAYGNWVESMRDLGTFRVLAEATVRPRTKGGAKAGAARRQGRPRTR